MKVKELNTDLIAPCGMNCGLCYAYQRDKNKCPGCNGESETKPKYCRVCTIKNCEKHTDETIFCFNCEKYPCTRLKQLDKRYREKYAMSMIQNQDCIKKSGIKKFVASEKERWACTKCGAVICVHHKVCSECGEISGVKLETQKKV